jgi:hypothetical protein
VRNFAAVDAAPFTPPRKIAASRKSSGDGSFPSRPLATVARAATSALVAAIAVFAARFDAPTPRTAGAAARTATPAPPVAAPTAPPFAVSQVMCNARSTNSPGVFTLPLV